MQHRGGFDTATPQLIEERYITRERFFMTRCAGFYRLLFATALLVCGFFMFRPTPLPLWFVHSDKWVHSGSFFTLVVLGYCATSRVGVAFLIMLAGLLALVLGSEWVQGSGLLPLRTADGWDLVANLSGCVLGLVGVAGLEILSIQSKRKGRVTAIDQETRQNALCLQYKE